MAWAGCNASGNAGLGFELWLIGGILAGIVSGEWAIVLIMLIPFATIFYVWFLVKYEDVILEKYND